VTLRVAVIGAGVIGSRRAECAAAQSRLVVVADINETRAAQLADRYGARHTNQWEEAVSASDVDLVAVCTTNKFLAPIAIASLKAGKHVLCEKPMGRNASEAAEIAEVARAAHRIVKVGFTLRYHPALRRAHEICAKGDLGPIYFVRAAYGHGGRPGYEKEWRGDPELAGGGELLDQGVHLLDLSRWFLGNLEVLAAITPRWFWEVAPLEDNAFALLRGSKGEVASIHTSWTFWKNTFSFEVAGRDGYARITGLGGSYGNETLTIGHRGLVGSVPQESVTEFDQPDSPWKSDWEDLIASIEQQRKPEVDATDGVAVMQLVDQVYARANDMNSNVASAQTRSNS
jgi:predicted dehydrogenase